MPATRRDCFLTTLRPLKRGFAAVVQTHAEEAGAIAEFVSSGTRFEQIPSGKNGATSTFDEAYDLLAFASGREIRRVIIVTDSFHTRRALLAFSKIFDGKQIGIEAAAAKNDDFSEENWWRSDRGLSAYLLEPIKYLVYLFTNRNVEAINNT